MRTVTRRELLVHEKFFFGVLGAEGSLLVGEDGGAVTRYDPS